MRVFSIAGIQSQSFTKNHIMAVLVFRQQVLPDSTEIGKPLNNGQDICLVIKSKKPLWQRGLPTLYEP